VASDHEEIPSGFPEAVGDCHTSDIGHWFAMTGIFFYEVQPSPFFDEKISRRPKEKRRK
jgi:hypothetical protein